MAVDQSETRVVILGCESCGKKCETLFLEIEITRNKRLLMSEVKMGKFWQLTFFVADSLRGQFLRFKKTYRFSQIII